MATLTESKAFEMLGRLYAENKLLTEQLTSEQRANAKLRAMVSDALKAAAGPETAGG